MNALTPALRMLTCLAFLLAATAFADGPAPADVAIADMNVQGGLVVWAPLLDEAMALTVSGPNGIEFSTFAIGETVSFSLVSDTGTLRPDGSYTYRLVVLPKLGLTADGASVNGRSQSRDGAERHPSLSQAGSFSIQGSQFADPSLKEAHSAAQPNANKDQVIADDLIVDGSICAGFDCVNGESFSFDTLRLKENSVRFHFDDTSVSPGFPFNDWRLIANDTGNGGLNRFSIEDATAGRIPFTIEAGAPRDSLYVDDNGSVGFGTSTPAKDAHITSGDSPTLRLEQDGSSTFTPHSWDLAGNETNFFVRDVDNNNLTFRIRAGAPEDSIYVDTNGDVGMGTDDPESSLHVIRDDQSAQILVQEASNVEGTYTLMELETTGGLGLNLRPRFTMTHGGLNAAWNFDILNNGNFAFIRNGGSVFTFTSAGDLRIEGDFISDGTTLNVPDYVFADDYHLMPLDDVKTFIETENHLPHVPSASEIVDDHFNLTEMQLTLLRKVEELTLYTLDQHDTIRQHQETITELQQLTRDQQKLIEQLLNRPDA